MYLDLTLLHFPFRTMSKFLLTKIKAEKEAVSSAYLAQCLSMKKRCSSGMSQLECTYFCSDALRAI